MHPMLSYPHGVCHCLTSCLVSVRALVVCTTPCDVVVLLGIVAAAEFCDDQGVEHPNVHLFCIRQICLQESNGILYCTGIHVLTVTLLHLHRIWDCPMLAPAWQTMPCCACKEPIRQAQQAKEMWRIYQHTFCTFPCPAGLVWLALCRHSMASFVKQAQALGSSNPALALSNCLCTPHHDKEMALVSFEWHQVCNTKQHSLLQPWHRNCCCVNWICMNLHKVSNTKQ